jgi:hypothetical protein
VWIEKYQTITCDTPSELTNEADDTSVLDGKDEDETYCPTHDDYENMFHSTDVEDPTSPLMYDAYNMEGSSVLAPNYDVVSTPHPML